MSEQHTPGLMFVSEEITGQNEANYQASANNPDLYLEIEGYGTVAEIGGGDLATRRENARRIVACWNAFDGVSIDNISPENGEIA